MSLIFEHLLEDEEPESERPVSPDSDAADDPDDEQPADKPSAENGFVGKWI